MSLHARQTEKINDEKGVKTESLTIIKAFNKVYAVFRGPDRNDLSSEREFNSRDLFEI